MAPFFLDVWLETASENQPRASVKSEKKTLFFIPSNDDIAGKADWKNTAGAENA
jgi:hypothetical protein